MPSVLKPDLEGLSLGFYVNDNNNNNNNNNIIIIIVTVPSVPDIPEPDDVLGMSNRLRGEGAPENPDAWS